MPTNRSFFGSFLSAFRAHSSIQKAGTSTGPQSSYTSTQQASTSTSSATSTTTTNTPSVNRTIVTKATQTANGATTVAIQAAGQFQPTRQHSASQSSRSPGSPGSGAFTPIQSRGRRGSDSSNEGFKEIGGQEKWYIGGRTAGGEERFYKLSMVKRPKSIDRLSLDRMSL